MSVLKKKQFQKSLIHSLVILPKYSNNALVELKGTILHTSALCFDGWALVTFQTKYDRVDLALSEDLQILER